MAAQALPAVPNLAVVLLLGGRSSRMGSPKHLLVHPATQQPLYQHHLAILQELRGEGIFPEGVYVSARADQRDQLELPQGVDLVEDDPERNGDIGPASGILQAATAKPDATWLLLAVDLPFITRTSILHLLSSHPEDAPVSLFLHPSDGNPEPLFSVWTPAALEQLRQNCLKGRSGPCRAAKDVWGGKIVEGKGGVRVLEEHCVTDADTPEEWAKAVAALARSELAAADSAKPLTPPPSPPAQPVAPFTPTPRRSVPFHTAIQLIRSLPLRSPISTAPVDSTPSPVATATAVRLPLVHATGGVAAAPVHATFPHPLHDNSAMDGYAVPSSLLLLASPSEPILLPVLGRIVAGDAQPPAVAVSAAGTYGCWEVMTGAVFPSEDFDAVVKVEDARRAGETDAAGRLLIRFEAPISSSRNRRRRGEQVKAGEIILREGERVSPEKVLLLAATGVADVAVRSPAAPPLARGRVGILATGKEVVSLAALAPGREPSPGQVIDCITPFLSSLLHSHGFEPVLLAPSGDSTTSFASTVSTALSRTPPLSLLLTVAGVSLGVTDHLPSTLASLGLAPVFHGVAIRPGGPVMLSHHEASGTPVLSLPGNPMASAACMRSFGEALLTRLGGVEGDWACLEVPREGAEAAAWADMLAKVRAGSSSFSAVPVDPQSGIPSLASAGSRTGPCALASLVGAGAWIRLDAGGEGEKTVEWRSF